MGKGTANRRRVGVDDVDVNGKVALRGRARGGRKIGRVEGEAHVGRAAVAGGRCGQEVFFLATDGVAVGGEGGERGEFSADDVKGFGDG